MRLNKRKLNLWKAEVWSEKRRQTRFAISCMVIRLHVGEKRHAARLGVR